MFNIRRLMALALTMSLLLFASTADAELKKYVGVDETSYIGEFESPDTAVMRAIDKATRNAQEQAGVYLSSYSRTKKFELTEDEIFTATNDISEVLDVKCVPTLVRTDGIEVIRYRATVEVTIDTDGLKKWLETDATERALRIEEARRLRADAIENDAALTELQARASGSMTESERAELTREFARIDAEFSARQKFAESNKLSRQKDYAGAVEKLSEAIELDPNYAFAYNNRGNKYNELGQFDRALSDLNRALELEPNLVPAYNNRGNALHHLGRYDAALADYDKALEINPNFVDAYYNRGLTFDALKQYDRALADYDKTLELNPKYSKAYNNRGAIYIRLEQYARALENFKRSIELNPNNPEAYTNRGITYALMNRYRRARSSFSKVIALDPNDASAYHLRGLCHRKLNRASKAEADFAKARELGYKE